MRIVDIIGPMDKKETKLIRECPGCSNKVVITEVSCPDCRIIIKGRFKVDPVGELNPEDLRFMKDFVMASGSLKAMAEKLGRSYPTVRSRLDQLISKLKKSDTAPEVPREKQWLVEMVESGELDIGAARRIAGRVWPKGLKNDGLELEEYNES
jgi:hypothetical protein